mmetsp:Transcript_25270/g.47959  ORF Transcript_25270/g.47959 Transcript_25270/m.47959 type:complete len:461 (-) Transcript_25270:160-1542(-)
MNFETTHGHNTIGSAADGDIFEESSAITIGGDALVAPSSPPRKKTSSKNKGGLNASSSSLSVDKDLAAPESPKKSKKKSSSGQESSSSSALNAHSEDMTSPDSPKKSKKKDKKNKDTDELPHDEQKIVVLVTEKLWAGSDATGLQTLHNLLRSDETRNIAKNRQVSVQLGTPLLVVKKMIDFPSDTVLQATGFDLMRCWGDMSSAPWFTIINVGGLARAIAVLTADVDEHNTIELQDNGLSLMEQMTWDSTAAKLLVQHQGVETLLHVAQGRNGKFIPRALESLCNICELGGTCSRKKVTELVGHVIQTSDDSKLVSALISVLSEMAKDGETVKGLLQGKGVKALAYAFQAFQKDKPSLSKKSFDLILLLASDTGPASRQAVADSSLLKTLTKRMTREPKDEEVQKQGCQLVLALVADQRKPIKESGILEPISKIFQLHGDNEKVIKLAHDTMNAFVDQK